MQPHARGRNTAEANTRDSEQESSDTAVKRYNLVLPESLYHEVQSLANKEHTTVIDLLRRFIKLGLLVTKLTQDENASLIIREGDKEREIILFI
jgi:hypothetical protein